MVANSKSIQPYDENLLDQIETKLHLNKNELKVRLENEYFTSCNIIYITLCEHSPKDRNKLSLIMLQILYHFLVDVNLAKNEGCSSDTDSISEDCSLPNLNTPHLRPFFKPIYTLVLTIVFYAILILIGVTGNNCCFLKFIYKCVRSTQIL